MPAPRTTEPNPRLEATVLVVDDDPATVDFLRTVIAQSSRAPRYRVVTANSGFRAEQACRSYQPAVVLLDLLLPDADGIDVLRALKNIDQGLEVIVISGQGTITRALEAGQAGDQDHDRRHPHMADQRRLAEQLQVPGALVLFGGHSRQCRWHHLHAVKRNSL